MTSNALAVLKKAGKLTKGAKYEALLEKSKKMAGSSISFPRISIRGSRFRMIVGGEQVAVRKQDELNVIIVDSSPIHRMYYEGTYSGTEDAKAPVCWSSDTDTPDTSVPKGNRQADKCQNCPQNVKGSGANDSRACRFSQRLAVLLEGDETEELYMLSVPATSIFGKSEGDDMPLQAYVKLLNANGVAVQTLVTEIYFDEDSESPKLFFRPVRELEENELDLVLDLEGSEEVEEMLALNISNPPLLDKHEDDEEEEKPKSRRRQKVEDDEDDEEEEKPKSRRRQKVEDDEDDEPEIRKKKKDTGGSASSEERNAKLAAALSGFVDD